MLSRGIRPFILRRTKAQVAPELPARTELTMHCDMVGAQQELYDELRDHYRTALLGRIARDGLQKSKMHVLEALLRLRQAACHPGLIDPRHADVPSAKFEALLPQLAEVREEGHKALVFSQFTSLLALLRPRLDAAGIDYEYLDGRTQGSAGARPPVPDRSAVRAVPDQPEGRRARPEPDGGRVRVPARSVVEPGGRGAGDRSRAPDRPDAPRVRVPAARDRDTVEEKIAELQRSKRDLADAILQADAGLLRNLKQEDLEIFVVLAVLSLA